MKLSARLSVVFCIVAAFLLGIEVAAVFVVDRLNSILSDTSFYNQQLDQAGAAVRAILLAPDHVADHLARVKDLSRWARTEDERKLLQAARNEIASSHSAAAIAPLEQLSAYYCRATANSHAALVKVHQHIMFGIILVMVDSIFLFLLLTRVVRQWLLHPLADLGDSMSLIASGNLDHRLRCNADEEFERVTISFNTITARLRELEKRIADEEKYAVLGHACTHITHNVRSLLNSIRSLAQHESNVGAAQHGSRVGFNYVIATVNKLDHWVRDLHNAVRPLDGNVAALQVEPIIHDALSLLQPILSERNLTVDYQAPDELPDVLMDRGLFEQAFVAVITNAIEASPDNGRIAVILKNGSADRVTIRIEDEGTGMNAATREHAFEPFFSTKPERPGLGLSVAQAFVKQHGGEIEIESAPEKGTRVIIHLPAASKSARSASTHQ